jgi:hypothetical protein
MATNTYAIYLTLDEESDQFVKDFIQWKAKQESRSVASMVKLTFKKEMESFVVNSDENGRIDFKVIK